MLTIDQIYRYRSLATQRQGYCRLRIYTRRGGHVVVLSEVANNPGQSVTAGSDIIATRLVERYQLNPESTLWIEHWPADYKAKGSEDAYAAVNYRWVNGTAISPRWRRLSSEQVAMMIGVKMQ